MSDTPTLVLALLGGTFLGGVFFGGLWWTVRRGVSSPHPVVWFLGSVLFRTASALGGFYVVSRGDWRKLVACLIGFLAARILVTRFIRASAPSRGGMAEASGR